MGEVELGFEVQLDRHLLTPVLRLPPALAPVRSERRHDVLDVVAGSIVGVRVVRATRVAHKTLVVLVFEVADDTETFWAVQAARRRRRQVILSADQQVPGSGVATTLLTRTWRSPIS